IHFLYAGLIGRTCIDQLNWTGNKTRIAQTAPVSNLAAAVEKDIVAGSVECEVSELNLKPRSGSLRHRRDVELQATRVQQCPLRVADVLSLRHGLVRRSLDEVKD